MATVTFGLSTLDDTKRQVAAAFRGEAVDERIDFASVEVLWQVLTPRRWRLLQVMTGQGPLAIREVARRLGRDVKAVHGDVHALLTAGVLDRVEDGRVVLPYDEVHVDFTLQAGV